MLEKLSGKNIGEKCETFYWIEKKKQKEMAQTNKQCS